MLDTRAGSSPEQPGVQLLVDMGTRFWKLNSALKLEAPPLLPGGPGINAKVEDDTSWWDWIMGARLLSTVTDHVHFSLAGNLGGFGLGNSSRFTWEVTGIALFRVWRVLHVDVGYRVLQAIRNASGNLPLTKLTMSGPALGLTAAF